VENNGKDHGFKVRWMVLEFIGAKGRFNRVNGKKVNLLDG
jgi:hypothetical protein